MKPALALGLLSLGLSMFFLFKSTVAWRAKDATLFESAAAAAFLVAIILFVMFGATQ